MKTSGCNENSQGSGVTPPCSAGKRGRPRCLWAARLALLAMVAITAAGASGCPGVFLSEYAVTLTAANPTATISVKALPGVKWTATDTSGLVTITPSSSRDRATEVQISVSDFGQYRVCPVVFESKHGACAPERLYVSIQGSDPQVTWMRELGDCFDFYPTYAHPGAVCETNDGDYLFAATVKAPSVANASEQSKASGLASHIVLFDALGDIQWEKTFFRDGSEEVRAVAQASDGGFFVTGNTVAGLYVMKLAADGSETWTTNLDAIGAAMLEEVESGAVVVGGYIQATSAKAAGLYLAKVDAIGALVWQRTFAGQDTEVCNAGTRTRDGGFVLVGTRTNYDLISSPAYSSIRLIRTDVDGNLLWQNILTPFDSCKASAVQETEDGGYLVAGEQQAWFYMNATAKDTYLTSHYFCLVKADETGCAQWIRQYGVATPYSESSAVAIAPTSDGGYLTTGMAGVYKMHLVRLDAKYDLMWEKPFPSQAMKGAIKAARQSSDGGFVLIGAGMIDDASSGTMYAIKTDVNGDCTPSIVGR